MIRKEMKEEQQYYVNKAKELLLLWQQRQNILFYCIEIIPHYVNAELKKKFTEMYGEDITFKTSLDILIFYKTEAKLKEYTGTGIVEKTKKEFMRILEEIGYVAEFNDNIRFEFDSDENVKKNYRGNYFFRLR